MLPIDTKSISDALAAMARTQRDIERSVSLIDWKSIFKAIGAASRSQRDIEQVVSTLNRNSIREALGIATRARREIERTVTTLKMKPFGDAVAAISRAHHVAGNVAFHFDLTPIARAVTAMTNMRHDVEQFTKLIASQLDIERLAHAASAMSQMTYDVGQFAKAFSRKLDVQRLDELTQSIESSSSTDISADEFEAALAIPAELLSDTSDSTWIDIVDRWLEALERQPNAKVKKLLFDILVNLLCNIIVSVALSNSSIEPIQSKNRDITIKEIRKLALHQIDDRDLLKRIRIVSHDSLKIRSSPNSKSSEVSRLAFGTYVRLIGKQKYWANIEWEDERTGEFMNGWTRCKYLKRIER